MWTGLVFPGGPGKIPAGSCSGRYTHWLWLEMWKPVVEAGHVTFCGWCGVGRKQVLETLIWVWLWNAGAGKGL